MQKENRATPGVCAGRECGWKPGSHCGTATVRGGAQARDVERAVTAVETDPRRVFGQVVKAYRERAGLTQKQLSKTVFCSDSLISAIENGTKPAQRDLAERIDDKVGADGIIAIVWPVTTGGKPSVYADGLESAASAIHDWESRFVPGLLQTPDYARSIMRSARPLDTDEKIEADVTDRMERQAVFGKENPPVAWFVIDESVLYRPFGGKPVMHSQLVKLEKMSGQPGIIIQVMRFAATGHPGSEGPSRIMEFTDKPPVWYSEVWNVGRMTDAKDEVSAAMTYFNLIRASALPPDQSARFIATVRSSRYE